MGRRLGLWVGWSLVVVGFVIIPLPGPMGTPTMAVGALIILRRSVAARRRFVRLKRRWPRRMGQIHDLIRKLRRWRARGSPLPRRPEALRSATPAIGGDIREEGGTRGR